MAKKKTKIKRSNIINKSEIARQLDLSPQYVGQLMNGIRHSEKRLAQINAIIHKELKFISRAA